MQHEKINFKYMHTPGLNSDLQKVFWSFVFLALAFQFPAVAWGNFYPPPELTESRKKEMTEEQIKQYEEAREAIFALLDPYTGKSIREAFIAKDQDQLLKGFKSFSVSVYLNSPATDVISKEDLKTKIELALRRNGIKVDEKFGTSISVSVDAMKLQQERGYFFRTDTKLIDMAYTHRDSGYAKFPLYLWNDGGLGVGPAQTVKSAIVENVISAVERFSNAYLGQNPDTIVSPPAKEQPSAKKPAQKK